MKTASKNTDVKQTLARGSAKMLRKLAIIAARSKGAGGGVATPRKAKNATMVTINPNEPRIANTPRQPNMSPITPAIEEPTTLLVRATASNRLMATWRCLTGTRSPVRAIATGNIPPAHQPRRDAHGQEQREAHRHSTDQRRQRDDQQAEIHQPGLAEEVAGDAQRGLHQRIRQGEGARQQRGRLHVDREIVRDHWNHGFDCACEEGLRKNHKADDFQDGWDDRSRSTFQVFILSSSRAGRSRSGGAAGRPFA